MTVAASATAERKTFGHLSYRVATRRQSFSRPNMISIRLRRLSRRLSSFTGLPRDFRPGMRGFMPLSLQRFSEPVGVIASISQQPLRLRQAAQQGRSAGIVADLACGHEEAERAPIGIGGGMQLGVHAALRSADQTAALVFGPPFSTAGWSPRGAPSGRSRRSSPSSGWRPRRPGHPSSGRRPLCHSTASSDC